MFHSTQTIDNTETSGLDISRYVFGTTRQANKVTKEGKQMLFQNPLWNVNIYGNLMTCKAQTYTVKFYEN